MAKGVALTDAEIHETINAVQAAGGNRSKASAVLGISRGGLDKRMIAGQRRGFFTTQDEAEWRSRESTISGRRLPQSADECWALLDDWIGRSPKPKADAPKARQRGVVHGVAAGDFHGIFHDPWAVSELIRRESGRDLLVVNGDLSDLYSFSRFLQYEQVPVERELAAVDALCGLFNKHFADTLIDEGNHDARFEKQIRAALSLEMMHAVEFLTGGELNPIRAISKRYPRLRFPKHQVGRHGIGWFVQEHDVIFAHAEKFSRVPGSALRSIDEWFTDQADTLGLKPWRVLVQAHTHQLGMFPWKSDRLLVEGGCMCGTHGYQLSPRIGGRPQRLGYVTFTQRDGITDLNSVRLVWLDADRKAA